MLDVIKVDIQRVFNLLFETPLCLFVLIGQMDRKQNALSLQEVQVLELDRLLVECILWQTLRRCDVDSMDKKALKLNLAHFCHLEQLGADEDHVNHALVGQTDKH